MSTQNNPAFVAMVAAYTELQNPPKTSRVSAGPKSYHFAPLPEILDLVRPILGKHGLCVRFTTQPQDGAVLVVCEVVHTTGTIVGQAALLSPGGNNMQAVGSGLTYARRYALTAALGIAADDDDDGESAKPAPKAHSVAPPKPSEPPPLSQVLAATGLTEAQVDRYRSGKGKPSLATLDATERDRFAMWLSVQGVQVLAAIRAA
jgi:hypothetical protein